MSHPFNLGEGHPRLERLLASRYVAYEGFGGFPVWKPLGAVPAPVDPPGQTEPSGLVDEGGH